MTHPTYTPAGTEPLIDRLRRAVIGRYDVYAELGQGGMASVYLALDLALDRKVAIKVMSPQLANSPDNVERFKREAKVAASLNHPHIIGVYAVGDDPELAYFVMKYIEGRGLDSVVRDEGPQSVPFVQSVIASAGKALHYANTRGVVHRDVKPANFMIDQDGWLVVTDFGIAKQGDLKGLTVTGSIVGTPYYMSPEQFSGKPITGAADQYALGVVAYELLSGGHPYPGDSLAEVMKGHLIDDVPHIRAVRPEVPAEFDACIAKMMAKDPTERFPTLEDAVLAIGAISPTVEIAVRTQIIELAKIGAAQQPKMSVPISPTPLQRPRGDTKPMSKAPTAAAATAPAMPIPVRTQGSKMPMVVGGVLLLLAGIGGGIGLMKEKEILSAPAPEEPVAAVVDSSAIRDSIARVASADSVARADSAARSDSLARVARADSVARVEAARIAARTAAARTAVRPAPTRAAVSGNASSGNTSSGNTAAAPTRAATTPTRAAPVTAPAPAPTRVAPAPTAPARTTASPKDGAGAARRRP